MTVIFDWMNRNFNGQTELICMTNTRLKQLLFERGIKARWLAERCGLNEGGLNQVINGKRLPTLETALRIARALDTTVENLWGDVIDDNEL